MSAEAAYELFSEEGGTPTRPPMALVLDPPPEKAGARIDWSDWYLTDEEDMGQNPDQGDNIKLLLSCMLVLASERLWENVRIAFDEFFAWVQGEPLVRVSPDVLVMDDPPPRPYPRVWETWKPGINPPRFALEIVSDDWKKDYESNPPKYAQLGTSELVIFDPEAAAGETTNPRRVPLQVYRREQDGAMVRVPVDGLIARSEELDAWLVVMIDGPDAYLRFARDPEGRDLVPTEAEARLEAERQRAEAEQQRAEAEQQRAEAERRRAEAERRRAEADQRRAEDRARVIRRLDQRLGPLSPEQLRGLEALDTEALLDGLLTAKSSDDLL